MVQAEKEPESIQEIFGRARIKTRRVGGIHMGDAPVDAQPHPSVSDVHFRRLEGEVRRSHPHRRAGMQPAPCVQALLQGAEETEVPHHMQRVPGHLPLDQERVWARLQEEEKVKSLSF